MYEIEKPASTPAKDCSSKWGCRCRSCLTRDEIWKVHMHKNGTDGDDNAKLPASSAAENWPMVGHEQPHSSAMENDGW